jgi:DNA-binding NarL/FixJ family response regulator
MFMPVCRQQLLPMADRRASHRQIACKRFIGVTTAKTHVHSILGKLRVESAYLTAGLARSMLCEMSAVLHGR